MVKLNRDQSLKMICLTIQKKYQNTYAFDLGRNDLSRVTQPGSVNVTDKMYIEYFSHVMHIVSNIEGIIDKNKKKTDVLFSGFPAGTVTGARKLEQFKL